MEGYPWHRMHEKLASSLAVLCSAAVHALLLAAGVAARPPEPGRRAPLRPDSWATSSVEVGTVPDARPAVLPPTAQSLSETETPRPSPSPTSLAQSNGEREPAPAPRRAAPSRSALGTPEAVASPASGAADAPPVPAAGSFGALGLPPGVRHLANAFTRALPAGAYTDGDWSKLPLGPVSRVHLSLEVTPKGELGELEIDAEGLLPVIERMLRRAALLLRSGRFSLDPSKLSAGEEHFDLEVVISERPLIPNEFAAPQDLFAQRFEPPTRERPGYAEFTLNSGRHVRVEVRIANSGPR